ncbi:hypothetical protein LR48_Vigan05g077700 [Vigna angularis]|uniref:Uncharacterized protein n=1 Tax=Phaseolus angularis TaxID=3914 RepID=A0A0L9UK77_PHAAN|nr:hypothetical protein LR48_Vigan05g077700 [Vigna angularis]
MEMHLRFISQKLNVKVNTEVNLKEEGQAIVTESDKTFAEEKIGRDEEKEALRLSKEGEEHITKVSLSGMTSSSGKKNQDYKIQEEEEEDIDDSSD